MIKDIVQKEFNNFIKDTLFPKPEVMNLCLNHPAKQKVIDGVASQIAKAEVTIRVDIMLIKQLAREYARIFAQGCLNNKEKEMGREYSLIPGMERQAIPIAKEKYEEYKRELIDEGIIEERKHDPRMEAN